jgi:fused signal recognition particle receptor
MFGFLKKKLKEGIEKITKTISEKEEEKIEQAVEEVKKEEHLEESKKELIKEVEKEIEKPEKIEGVKITYFVHGTTTDNEKELASGWADAELSELGNEQAIKLGELIANKKFDVVFCSDMKRAENSAKLTFGDNVKIIQDKRLRECNYGDFTRADSKKVDSLSLENICKAFPNGESYKDVEKRIILFLNDLFKDYYGKQVAIVAHKGPQLALDVLLKGKTWEQAIKEDWRLKEPKEWKPGWDYELKQKIEFIEPKIVEKAPEIKIEKKEVKLEIKKEEIKAPEIKIAEKAEAKIEEAKEIIETAKEIEKIPEAKIEEKPKKGFFERILKRKPKIEKPKAEEVKELPKEERGIIDKIKKKITEKKIEEDDVKDILKDMETGLISSDVAVEVSDKIISDLRKNLVGNFIKRGEIENVVKRSFRDSILDILKVESFDLLDKVKTKKPFLIVFLGFNGVGKTTSIARVGHLLKKNGVSCVFAAGDSWRAAAIEQLEEHGKNLGIDVIKHKYGADPAAVIFDAVKHAKSKNIDVVLADTAGRSHSNVNLMDELKKIIKVNKPDLNILVLDALTGNDIYDQCKMFNDAVGVDGLIITKADVYEKGGATLSASFTIKRPILYLGVGQDYEDLEKFDSKRIVEKLLE